MPGQDRCHVLMMRMPEGVARMSLDTTSAWERLEQLCKALPPDVLEVTEWAVDPDATLTTATWPE